MFWMTIEEHANSKVPISNYYVPVAAENRSPETPKTE